MYSLFNAIGTAGVILIFTAYFLGQKDQDFSRRMSYSAMNLAGALLIIVSLLHDWNMAHFVLEVIWAMISLYGVIRSFKTKAAG